MNKLKTNQVVPIGNNQSSRTAGQHGPTLLEDYQLLEKLAHFDRERVPERVSCTPAAPGRTVCSKQQTA